MAPKPGDTVRVHYRGTLADGSEFDSSAGREPLEFEVGAGQVIPGFDEAVADLEIGGSATVNIEPDNAYGERAEEAVQEFPREAFGDQVPEVGWTVELQAPDGSHMAAIIKDVGDEMVTLDFNHPLAGEQLTFEIELVEIVAGPSGIILP
ncbi:MAG: peptidylprolyl isomerase [Coriobacteriia bacterium]|nr:peptidylprolyl isomerase [Coriobacteriia bacterium]